MFSIRQEFALDVPCVCEGTNKRDYRRCKNKTQTEHYAHTVSRILAMLSV